MAGQTLTLTIASQLQKAGFTEAAEHMRVLQKEIAGTEEKTNLWKTAVEKVKAAVTVTAIIAFYKSAVDEAVKAEQTQLRLGTAIENTGENWGRSAAKVNAFTQALSESSRFAAGDLQDALGLLVQRTNSLSVAQANLQTVMGISVATGRGMADVADQIGRAANGSQRDVARLAKEFGITGDNAKSAEFVLGMLEQRFGKLAVTEKTAQKDFDQLKNSMNDLKQSVGEGVIPIFQFLAREFTAFFRQVVELGNGIAGLGATIVGFLTANQNLFNEGVEGLRKAWARFLDPLKETGPAAEGAGKRVTAAARAMSDELQAILQELNSSTGNLQAQAFSTQLEQLQAQTDFKKAELRKRADYELLLEKDKNELMLAIDRNAEAQRVAIVRKGNEEKMRATVAFGSAMGAATGRMIAGEKDAWKSMIGIVIDALVAQLTAIIIARQAAAIARNVSETGWAGFIEGGLQAAAIAAVGAAAKSALNSGSSSFDSSGGGAGGGGGGGGWGTSTPTTAASPAAARPSSALSVNIYGDLYGEPAFVDRLAMKISEAVENRDVRMVATSTVP